ncbi:dimeric alpha-beta barrel [Pochonia chlamydosporia 170]|uniref:Dimeric alpha-beta barrel n=1 Tax=Pochonia chlamydosporia 170 TaxID=1380566 RepID=A0A179F809_METCM|nr:dimeric alpha-beta barrel [Pochonia chlamydosporia 170]OAQ61557.1 dimeric alpha-beta barrel [Pochonia chlamydosporia 170]
MASSSQLPEFLVVVPDKPGVREKRLEVRPTHFKNMTPNVESGDWKMGGALLNEVPTDSNAANFDFFGSTLVCKAESKEAVLEQLKKDIYATSGVWDLEKVQIYPFICAFRKP